ncbi:ABC transporter [Moraxella macacae 0408225]|uniref:Transport permease protein n=1 Tax=Moraxella macacae 0408225 TaxID=1230338 RepID=L2F8W1_9GAMM|nr:ABC transporter permease [Moraxella macacae]ELA09345.1 ABC transporter [Moraxella macacae 0408225]
MSIQLPPYRPVKRRNGLQVMLASIHALLMRELQTRFGGYRLGYFWAPLEIIFQVVMYVIIFGTVMKRVLPGMEYPLFLLSGMIPFFMFQKNATRALGAVDANRGLLMYRSVRHIDVILARSFLEFLIYFFTFWLLLGMLWGLFGTTISFANLHIVLLCWIGLFFFSLGVALIMMVVGHYGGEISKIISIVFTILYFASGIIYSIHIVPQPYLDYLLYNPFVHNIELIRHSLSPTYPNHHIDIWYFFKWMIAVDFVGLLLYKACENDFIRKR